MLLILHLRSLDSSNNVCYLYLPCIFRSTRVASFTSLSARLGSIVVGLRSKIATFLSTPPTGKTHSRSNSSVSTSSLGAGQNRTEKPSFNQPAALLEVVLRVSVLACFVVTPFS